MDFLQEKPALTKQTMSEPATFQSAMDIISNVGMNFTDAGLSGVNAALIYKFVMDPGVAKFKVPMIDYYLPSWAVYGLVSGATSLATGIITRSILPSVIAKTQNPKIYNLMQVGPLIAVPVGMLFSYGMLWNADPAQALAKSVSGEILKKKEWMPLLKDGIAMGGSQLAAQFETNLIWGSVTVATSSKF